MCLRCTFPVSTEMVTWPGRYPDLLIPIKDPDPVDHSLFMDIVIAIRTAASCSVSTYIWQARGLWPASLSLQPCFCLILRWILYSIMRSYEPCLLIIILPLYRHFQ